MKRDLATQRQVDAATPERSTWLSANAGSGKTRVLTDRVARLLFDGVSPQNILCLTYTKAAAAEMQNRLFDRLGVWTTLPSPELETALRRLGVDADLSPQRLRDARTLFAKAIDTPGGLKIQTIHSFCSMLLRRFPLEAGVTLQFKELDETAALQLRRDVFDDMAESADAHLIDDLATVQTEYGLDDLLGQIARNSSLFQRKIDQADVHDLFGDPPDLATILESVFAGGTIDLLKQMATVLDGYSNASDVKLREALRRAIAFGPSQEALDVLAKVLVTQTGKNAGASKAGSLPRSEIRKGPALGLVEEFDALCDRCATGLAQQNARRAAEKTAILCAFGHVFCRRYDAAKARRGVLDFDDLIGRAKALLSDAKSAAWVLYRLDGGIDHLLVDEAQDTSPDQWDVISRLTEEFGVGEGASTSARSIFVVGDKKQSIYSFQGADPTGFDRMRDTFAARFRAIENPLQELELQHSFRSSSAILETVDQTFASNSGPLGQTSSHMAFKADLPGRVDLWPPVTTQDDREPDNWFDPVDRMSSEAPVARLARAIAAEITRMIKEERRPIQTEDGSVKMAPITAGDVLILLPRRSALFHEIIRACKQVGLPMAGSDQVRLGAEIAVRDISSLLRFLSLAEDDLSLAEALRSPLFGWDEKAIFDLAEGRSGVLWEALRKSDHAETLAILNDLRSRAEFLRPYELIERILVTHEGRGKLLARLGVEAEEGIDLLLAQALAYETTEVPTLSGFLGWLGAADLKVKRTIDASRDELRIMTIHGSKGLEAPIVFMPDTHKRRPPTTPEILTGGRVPQWRVRKDVRPEAQKQLADAQMRKEEDERQRLLYVAMTRAETWLICCAAGDVGKTAKDSWYLQIEEGLRALSAETVSHPIGEGLRYAPKPWDLDEVQPAIEKERVVPPLPSWATTMAPDPDLGPPPIIPSDLPGPKALPGEGGGESEAAKLRGTKIHHLLEVLPMRAREDWSTLDVAPDLLKEAADIVTSPKFAHLFAENTLSEVEISGHLADRPLIGTIDRLIIEPQRVTAVDFKSNQVVPRAPELVPAGLLAQMGAYAQALAAIYPDRDVHTALVWTKTATWMDLPHDLVMDALRTAMAS